MAAPSYDTDLKTITDCETNTGWSELTGHTTGSADAQDTETYIQGSAGVSQPTGQAQDQTAGMEFDFGSNITIAAGECVWAWQIFLSPGAIKNWHLGGMRIVAGSSSGNVGHWNAMGVDAYKYPYGGWQNTAIDPRWTPDSQDGTPAGTWRIFGSLPNMAAKVTKGNPHAVDAYRYGRGDLIMTNGDVTNGYATFAGASAYNDGTSNRFGLLQSESTGYLWKGLMSFGTAATAVDFRDSNKNIVADWTPRTYAGFTKMEVNNASSRVDLTNISFGSAYNTSPYLPEFEMVANADVNFDSVTFADFNSTIFQSNATVLDSTFRRNKEVTLGAGVFNGSTFSDSMVAADGSSAYWNDNSNVSGNLDNTTWIHGSTSGNLHHALRFGAGSATTQNLTGWTVSGFNSSDGQNDSVLYFDDTGADVTWTINVSGNSGTISYKKARATDTVNVLTDQRTLTLRAVDTAGNLITASTDFTLVRQSDETVLQFTEDQTDGIDTYTYSYTTDTTCYVNVVTSGSYIPTTKENVVLGNADATVDIVMATDRVFSNP